LAELREVPIEQIEQPAQPVRRQLGDLAALAESMQDYGLQQPIALRADGKRLMLTSGLRRLAAARLLGWTRIPAFVRTVDADQAYLLDLIENLQRQDLTADEEADALGELIRTRGWTLQQLADAVKRSVGYVSKRIRVFDDPNLRDAIVARGLPVSTAEELLGAEGTLRAMLIERAIAERWDQTRARHELLGLRDTTADAGLDERGRAASSRGQAPVPSAIDVGRPRGLTRAVREFHGLIAGVQPSDLTAADRAALRALYRDLVMLARAPLTPQPRVFPALPAEPVGAARQARRTKAGRGRE